MDAHRIILYGLLAVICLAVLTSSIIVIAQLYKPADSSILKSNSTTKPVGVKKESSIAYKQEPSDSSRPKSNATTKSLEIEKESSTTDKEEPADSSVPINNDTTKPVEVEKEPSSTYEQDDSILISGMVDVINNKAVADYIYHLGPRKEQPSTEGEYTVELQDENGNILISHSFDLSYGSEGSRDIGSFVEVIPYDAETSKVLLKKGETVLTDRTVSKNSPKVEIIYPSGGETFYPDIKIKWTAYDLDGDELHYTIEHSSDNGATWSPVVMDIDLDTNQFNEVNYTLNQDYFPGGTQNLIKVIASDGVNTGSDQSDSGFSIYEKKPEVTILYPTNNAEFLLGEKIYFEGAGYDLEDGMLNDSALFWWSNIVGELGYGEEIETSMNSGSALGAHNITLYATDSTGKKSEETITIYIRDSTTTDTDEGTVTIYTDKGVIINHGRASPLDEIPFTPEKDSRLYKMALLTEEAPKNVEFPYTFFTFEISRINPNDLVNISFVLPRYEYNTDTSKLNFWTYDTNSNKWTSLPAEAKGRYTLVLKITDNSDYDMDPSEGNIDILVGPGYT